LAAFFDDPIQSTLSPKKLTLLPSIVPFNQSSISGHDACRKVSFILKGWGCSLMEAVFSAAAGSFHFFPIRDFQGHACFS
jgi:hypothetical protein